MASSSVGSSGESQSAQAMSVIPLRTQHREHSDLRGGVATPDAPQCQRPSAMASTAREFPGARGTGPAPSQGCAAREAIEAPVRSRSSSGPGYRRSWGRSPRTLRWSRPQPAHPRCGQADSARWTLPRGRAGREAEMLRPLQARPTGAIHGNREVPEQRRNRSVRYLPQSQRRADGPLNSPPGSRPATTWVWSSQVVSFHGIPRREHGSPAGVPAA
jgi:hypothetical protein